jgi:hypothetical protein
MVRINFFIFILFLVLSCGQQEFPDYNSGKDLKDYEVAPGVFSAEFSMLNKARLQVSALFWVRDDQFYAKVVMIKGPVKVRYQQFIHKGARCPDKQDDENKDGVIDFSESLTASGDILIPLDKFIEEQDKGSEWFPKTSARGRYYYSRSASIDRMMEDLSATDTFARDGISKLGRLEELALSVRTIILYGTSKNPFLPVACAVIREKAE